MDNLVLPCPEAGMLNDLNAPITLFEVENAVALLKSNKSPGPADIQQNFINSLRTYLVGNDRIYLLAV